MRTVLIFAHECAPFHRPESTIAAQRPAQFAKHLPTFGWRAIVVCCDAWRRRTIDSNGLDQVDTEVRLVIRNADPGSSVIIPTPSLRWDGLLDRVWRACASSSRWGSGLARRALTTAKFVTGDYSQTWQPCARAAAAVVAAEMRVDACIGEHGPDAGLFLGRWFSRRYGVPWLADFRDPILQPFKPAARACYAPVARRLVASAAGTINVNDVWARGDASLFGLPAKSIPNGFDPDEFDVSPREADPGRLTVAYTGRVDELQQIELFLDGLAKARRRLRHEGGGEIAFVYRGVSQDRVARLAAAAGVSDAVDARAHVSRDEALRLVSAADLLLLLSIRTSDPFYAEGFYPGKAFEYFGARRPILCVPGDRGLLADLLEETRTGVVRESPEAIANYLCDAARLHRREGVLPHRPLESAVMKYTRRNLAGILAGTLDEIVARNAALGDARARLEQRV